MRVDETTPDGEEQDGDDDAFDVDLSTEEDEDEIIAGLLGDHEDVPIVYRIACLMAAEKASTDESVAWSKFAHVRLQREHHCGSR